MHSPASAKVLGTKLVPLKAGSRCDLACQGDVTLHMLTHGLWIYPHLAVNMPTCKCQLGNNGAWFEHPFMRSKFDQLCLHCIGSAVQATLQIPALMISD